MLRLLRRVQVFPRMANHTNTHKMTGVGNALKRHYQALCLDYELAHPEDLVKQVGDMVWALVSSACSDHVAHAKAFVLFVACA